MNSNSLRKRGSVINLGLVPCYLLIISFFFPTRGSIRGITFYYIYALALLFFLFIVISKPIIYKIIIPKPIWIYGFVLVFMVFYSFQPTRWWYYISLILPFILSFLFIITEIRTKEKFNKLIDFIIVVFSIYSCFCIIESVTHYNIFDTLTNTRILVYEFTNEIRFGFVRNRGAVDISINNGMLLCLVSVLCLYRVIAESRRKYIIPLFLLLLASFFSLSRGVWIQLIVTFGMIILVMPGKRKFKLVGYVFFSLLFILFVGNVISSGFSENISKLIENMVLSIIGVFFDNTNSSLSGAGHRFILWEWVFNTVGSNYVFGLGIGTPVSVITNLGYNKISIEVEWLYVYYQMGLVGLIGFIIFQISSLFYAIKRTNKKTYGSYYTNLNYYFLAASVGYFIAMFSCSTGEDLRFYYIFFALIICYNKIRNEEKTEK